MSTQLHAGHSRHASPPPGFFRGLASLASLFSRRPQDRQEEQEAWNHWIFLKVYGFEVHITGPGVPTDPEDLATWEPMLEQISTLEFRPAPPDEGAGRTDLPQIQGPERLMEKLGPILASEEIHWIPDRQEVDALNLGEVHAKRFVAEKVIRDYDLTERLYRRALTIDPENGDLLGRFALFLHEVRRDADQAESFYR
ncbi:MAG: hypothetical protein HQL95_16395, partial [Magnetococcales bacterium]|nr:hypothetical protein [Magnetococcales bacterium]